MMLRTSQSHPLQIAELKPLPDIGAVGITFCPGKYQPAAMTGGWHRDLHTDLDAVRDWGAAAVVSLIETHEIEALGVTALGAEVAARHMHWYHLPIADVGIPAPSFETAWRVAGEELRSRLQAGFKVLVHCKGGLGRAGMVASRLLVELGLPADQAILHTRAVRPGAIETQAQEAHILACQKQVEPIPSTSEVALRDRARGALLGLAIGDALGTTLEFSRRDSYPLLNDMVGGGPFHLQAGQWTDDTAMALALADSLEECGGLDEADLMQRFTQWHEQGRYSCTGSCFDIGITTRSALMRWKSSGNPVAGDSAANSAGNGSLMRLAPIAIRYWRDRVALRDAAARQSRTTHAAPQAVEACIAFAELVADAIAGATRSEVLRSRSWAGEPQVAAIMAGSWRGKARSAIRASGYVLHSFEAALWSTGRSGNFTQAVLTAANLGEDADTTAAINGQLAGALEGMEAIPVKWRNKLAWRDTLIAQADALFPAT